MKTQFTFAGLIVSIALASTGCEQLSNDEIECINGRHIRAGVDATLSALQGLRDSKAEGILTDSGAKQRCQALRGTLDGILSHRVEALKDRSEDYDYEAARKFTSLTIWAEDVDGGSLQLPDGFFYDPEGSRGVYGGHEFAYGPEGVVAWLLEKYVEENLVGGEPEALLVAVQSLGTNLGALCSSGYYRHYVDNGYSDISFYLNYYALKVETAEFDTAVEAAITGIENDIIPTGTALYETLGCKKAEAFVAY